MRATRVRACGFRSRLTNRRTSFALHLTFVLRRGFQKRSPTRNTCVETCVCHKNAGTPRGPNTLGAHNPAPTLAPGAPEWTQHVDKNSRSGTRFVAPPHFLCPLVSLAAGAGPTARSLHARFRQEGRRLLVRPRCTMPVLPAPSFPRTAFASRVPSSGCWERVRTTRACRVISALTFALLQSCMRRRQRSA